MMLAPNPASPASFFSKTFLQTLGLLQVFFFFFFIHPSLLPTVMDPFSVTCFCTFTIHVVTLLSCNSGYISAKGCGSQTCVPTFECLTKLYEKGLMSANTISALILPMHRLCCWKERLLYSVPALVCAISLMTLFYVYLIAAVFFQYKKKPLY